MKRLLLILPILALACSTSIIKTTATPSTDVSSTEQALPHPIPATPEIVSTKTATATASLEYCIVAAAESLHMRDSSNVSGIVITWLKPGDQLILLPDPPSGDWVKVQFGDLTGWINSHYCER